MVSILASNNQVRLSFLMALLRDAGLSPVLLDAHMATMEGSAGAILCRLAVPNHEVQRAQRVLREADEL
ncbi:MAG TPA: DUF2007 domain-containing protein [Acetobacteraceae bacterium]|nr:DUF2007 domain-containing protein [Acetobacteraceae bacterium]